MRHSNRDLHTGVLSDRFKLNVLLDITHAINSNQSIEQLSKIFTFFLKEQVGLTKYAFIYKQEEWDVWLKSGIKPKKNENFNIENLKRFKEITVIDSSPSAFINEFKVVIPLYHNEEIISYLLMGDLESLRLNHLEMIEELRFFQSLAYVLLAAIENKKMVKMTIHQTKLKKELEVASEMQKMLFPSDLPSNDRMDISAKYISRHEIGGDYYDFIPINEEEYMLCIADVSGKGISAAMLMANFQATIRVLFTYQNFDFIQLLYELNDKVYKSSKGEKFITFFIAHYNVKSRKLTYVNAGHNSPFVTNGKKIKLLEEGSIGLGMLEELPFLNIGKEVLEANTTLILYTDGIVELENEKNEFFELDRLIQLVNQYYPLKMEDLNTLIFSKLDEWRGSRKFVDDTAIFSCRFY
ncbi:MAG: PP2C family protein-serine/threonine phosphatase [Flavobacteriia bacterium]|nr:PP2C family protein-serine/threonine phosphatase [Flavobacteriia bacterium]